MVAFALLLTSTLGARWNEVAANGSWPQPRYSHSAVIVGSGADETLLVFGGNTFDPVNQLFAYSVARAEWSQLKPAGEPPSKRYGHAAAATADGRMVVFGGYNGSFLGDVHELTLEPEPAWRRVDPAGAAPCARDGHSAVLSDDGRSILVFGGFDGKRHLNDAFALDVVGADGGAAYAWRPLRPRGPKPAARYLHAAQACDGGMLVFGGTNKSGGFEGDLWRLRLDGGGDEGEAEAEASVSSEAEAEAEPSWARVDAEGDAPTGRMGHAAATDPDGRLWTFGGFCDGAFSNALHVFEAAADGGKPGGRWRRIKARKPPAARHKHTLTATADGRLLVFGGNDWSVTRGFYEVDTTAVAGGGGGAGARLSVPGGATPSRGVVGTVARIGALYLVLYGLLGGGGKTILRLAVALFFVLEYRIPQRALLALRGGGARKSGGGAPRAALPAGVRVAPLRLHAKF